MDDEPKVTVFGWKAALYFWLTIASQSVWTAAGLYVIYGVWRISGIVSVSTGS